MRKFVFGAILLALCLAFAPANWGQAQITSGTVQGDVLDEKGGSVPGASVEAKNLDTNFVRTETTDGDGHFAFLNLAPGRYTLTITKSGFTTIVQQNVNLTVGQVLTLPVTVKVSSVAQQIIVTDVPVIEVTKTESSSTLEESAIATTPVLGRKFEDLLTLTPGVSISQGPDGDEININGQRGIFNNVSLDGGDYNNGFFGEQAGGQRAAVDISLEAVKEFQIIASGANAEYGRTAGGVVNVITKSGTNEWHGSAFEYFRTESLTAAASDGTPLSDFLRNQFGGSVGGPLVKNKLFVFAAGEGIMEDLTRSNLSVTSPGGACGSSPVFDGTVATDTLINSSQDCQRLALLNYFQSTFNDNEGTPVDHIVRNASIFGRVDYIHSQNNQFFATYNFDRSNNPNQTFDVPTYGRTANGIEGAAHIQSVNGDWTSTFSPTKFNNAHFSFSHETRPRAAIDPTSVPDTSMGFFPNFRFGQPFFLEPGVDELTWRTDVRDSLSIIHGKHTFKLGGEWLHTDNSQIFRGFFTGRYIFDDVTGFLHYAAPASMGAGFGPNAAECGDGTFTDITLVTAGGLCPDGSSFTGGPLLLYLQHGPTTSGESLDASGASDITNEDLSLFVQDTWKVWRNFTLTYGLRWDGQKFPDPTIPPSKTAYGADLANPAFPSDGKLHNQWKEFQPRIGFAWDIFGNGKSALRASYGIYNARQNMLTQVGAITTNGVQQQSIAAATCLFTIAGICQQNSAGGPAPTYPNTVPVPLLPPGTFPFQSGVTVFDKSYANPRIYATNVGYEQQLFGDYAAYADFTLSKGVHLTRFTNPNSGTGFLLPTSGADTVTYTGVHGVFPDLGDITDTVSSAKSLYRGVTVGFRKRMSHRFLFDANYTYSVDKDDDSNERDPFTFRYANLFDLAAEYSDSDRDERHRFNFYTVATLPWGIEGNVRMQAHSAQPITDNVNGDGSGAPCSEQNSRTRFVVSGTGVVDCGRNHLRKDNAFFTFDFGVSRPFHVSDHLRIIPRLEMFNTFNNVNNINPLSSPQLFDFNGFLRVGVGDPRQAQLSVRLEF
ncbi:MAG TPA: carboxypeptidase regulatory-like domain-containing protein [Candidatus Dormibacteraeota bacterium]|jgi:outer membrane receptor for ferrienterochelin and colicin|nr:carboxypeptidase regulatory-like domain-containing protein [Candidatus Dormibacteraeota bacterium]